MRSPPSGGAPSPARARAPPPSLVRATARRTAPGSRRRREDQEGRGRGWLPEGRSRPRRAGEPSVLADGQPVPDPLEGLLADPADVQDVLDLLEGTVFLAVFDDSLGVGPADPGEGHQLVHARRVDVDLLSGRGG